MDMHTLLTPERILYEDDVSSKKRAFEKLASCLAASLPSLAQETIFDALINREKLGCTSVGNGIAIPHACLPIKTPIGALLVVQEGIKMDTPDRKPVHIFLALLVPTSNALNYRSLMTDLAACMSQKGLSEQLCNVSNQASLLATLQHLCSPIDQPTLPPLAA